MTVQSSIAEPAEPNPLECPHCHKPLDRNLDPAIRECPSCGESLDLTFNMSSFTKDPDIEITDATGTWVHRDYEIDPKKMEDIFDELKETLQSYYDQARKQSNVSFYVAVTAGAIGTGFFMVATMVVIFAFILGLETDLAAIGVFSSVFAGTLVELVAGLVFYLYGQTTQQLANYRFRMETTQRFVLADAITGKLPQQESVSLREEVIRSLIRSAESASLSDDSDKKATK